MSVNTKDKTLLIITPDYPDEHHKYIGSIYIKNQVGYLKSSFKHIIIICPVLSSLKLMSNDKHCNNYIYDNVSVYYPRCFFIPRMIPFLSYNVKLKFDFRYNAIKNCIKKYNLKFDLIHSQFTYPSSYCASLLKDFYNIPYIATINEDSGWLQEEINLHDEYMTRAWSHADKLINLNSSDAMKLKPYNPNIVIIPYGYDSTYYPQDKNTCRKILHIPQNEKVLFTFGIFQKRKGFDYLIKTMDLLKNTTNKNIHCYIGGKSEIEKSYEVYLKQLVTDLQLNNNVHFIGFLRTSDIQLWMNACDLFVLPSLEEGFGITQVEALGCGKPVIATRNSGSMDIINNSDVGILCERANITEFSNAILNGLNREWDSDKIVKFSDKYRQINIIKSLLDVYKEVMDKYYLSKN